MNRHILIVIVCLVPGVTFAAEPKAPATVKALWADFDPRKDALETKVVREWEKDDITYRSVTFHVATFKGQPARMAGFFAFPKGVPLPRSPSLRCNCRCFGFSRPVTHLFREWLSV